jgi:hypothetical protein
MLQGVDYLLQLWMSELLIRYIRFKCHQPAKRLMIGDPDSCSFFRVLSSEFVNNPYKDKGFSLRSVVVFFSGGFKRGLVYSMGCSSGPSPWSKSTPSTYESPSVLRLSDLFVSFFFVKWVRGFTTLAKLVRTCGTSCTSAATWTPLRGDDVS